MKIVGISACPAGLAHTPMAAKALEKAGKALGYDVKMEQQGSMGQVNEITKEEAIELIHTSDDDTMILLAMADKIRQHFNDNSVDVCAIVNARSGKCPENCKFCAQSAHHETGVQVYPFMDDESILDAARKAKEAGAIRFSIVTSGRIRPYQKRNWPRNLLFSWFVNLRTSSQIKRSRCDSIPLQYRNGT